MHMHPLWFGALVAVITLLGPTVASTESNSTTQMLQPKIVGGTATDIEAAPYQVSVRLTSRDKRKFGSGHMCGGVLISQRLVATAAHCCYNSDTTQYRAAGEYVLVLGTTYLATKTNETLVYYLQQLIVHSSYDHGTLTNDIALMFINGYVPWTWPTARALTLNDQSLAVATACVITGWGVLISGGSSSNTLQTATVPTVSYPNCYLAYPPYVPRSQICAGYTTGGIDACQGDSGGPLMCNNRLSGLVSYGDGCGKPNVPGVYTNVSYFHDWIVQQNSSLNYSIYRNGADGRSGGRLGFVLLSGIFAAAAGSLRMRG
ncbi:trypsin eta isoform X2 [Drosophila miranda]|uniref:trypsin eta isoform X2 n=1 Tax=Drosophila miranda TaxID=7229 RepID=UPI0007E5C34E|nr:trypsin eta isoform X2 [Drosophila miranda]